MDVLHHFTSGFKAYSTETSYYGIDKLRQACGGAGFLNYSGISDIWEDVAPGPTYEGINVVMYQQSARYLFKQANSIAKGKTVKGYFEYLNRTKELCSTKSSAKTIDDFLSFEHLDQALATRSAFYIDYTFNLMKASDAPKKVQENELFAFEVGKMSRQHISYMIFTLAKKQLDEFDFKDKNIKPIVELLLKIFAVKQLKNDCSDLYETGFFGAGSAKLLDAAHKKLLVDLRPHMIPLVEISPKAEGGMLSAIGNKEGDIYECMLDTAKSSTLNKNKVPTYYEEYMKPTMQMRRPKL